jgi:hypothetical protein
LKNDNNKNVKSLLANIEIKQGDIPSLAEAQPTNELFTNKMNFIQTEFGIVKNLPINSKVKSDNNTNTNNDSKEQEEKTNTENQMIVDHVEETKVEDNNSMEVDSLANADSERTNLIENKEDNIEIEDNIQM